MKRLTALYLAITLPLVAACGEDEPEEPPPPPPQERCEADNLKAFAAGTIERDGNRFVLDLSSNDVSGRIFDDRELRIRLGSAPAPGTNEEQPLILRLVSNEEDPEFSVFAEQLADMTGPEQPLELQIYDASDYSDLGSSNLTSLSSFGCSIDDDATVCAQIGFDTSGTDILDDDDQYVYNAAGGTFTLEGFDTASGRMLATFDIELGPNLFAFQDPSTGTIEGCMWPEYDSRVPGEYWGLD